LSLFATYPLSIVWRKLPSTTLKHVYGIVVGLALLVFCLGPIAWCHSMITSLVTYAAVKILRPAMALRFVFIFAFVYMSASHIYRTLTDYMGWSLDFTGSQMIITLKLISFAFNLNDANVKVLVPRLEGISDAKALKAKERTLKNIEVPIIRPFLPIEINHVPLL
jgi:lysophospholipid acyltransferase